MRMKIGLACLAWTAALAAQQPVPPVVPPVSVPPGFGPRAEPAKPQPAQQQPPPAPAPAQPKPAVQGPPAGAATGGLNLQNAALAEVIDILARQLKINYILDARVRGGVVINTYGETKQINTRELLDTILRINGAAMVQVGDIYRIVPLSEVARLPIPIEIGQKAIADSDRPMLNLVFLKYASVEELAKLMDPFIGEFGKSWAYAPANLLLILDSSRNMRRLMELVALFDSDALANQRVRLYEVKNGRPSDIVKELEGIVKNISLSEKSAPVRFLAVDRINTIIAVASNPGVFEELTRWIEKLDTPVKVTAGSVDNYVYRVKYGRAETLSMAITMLYGGYGGFGGMGMGGFGGMGMGGMGGFGGMGMGGMGGYGGMGGMGGFGGAQGMFGGGGFGGAMPPGYSGSFGGYMGPVVSGGAPPALAPTNTPPTVAGGSVAVNPGAAGDLTGQYLGFGGMPTQGRIPRIVPNPLDNSLLIQATAQEYESIVKLLRDLDVPPRQVLIEAKIYEVSLSGAFASGVSAFLQNRGATGNQVLGSRQLTASLDKAAVNLSAGALVGQTRELLMFLATLENSTRAKVISAPSVIATDSIPATINVGTEVPTLTATAVTGVQSGGSSLFANQVQNRNSGVTLSITARINPSGIVTLIVNQEVSAPQAPSSGGIQSPSFSKRSISTQVTLQDGDTIAVGGIINESETSSSSGIPVLHKIPILGHAFGSRSRDKERTELIVFMTARVIYDTNEIVDASEELKSRLKKLKRIVQE